MEGRSVDKPKFDFVEFSPFHQVAKILAQVGSGQCKGRETFSQCFSRFSPFDFDSDFFQFLQVFREQQG